MIKIGLVAGDRISFRVIEDRDEAVSPTCHDTGEVDFPYVGRLKSGGPKPAVRSPSSSKTSRG